MKITPNRTMGELAEREGDLIAAESWYLTDAQQTQGLRAFLRLARVRFKRQMWAECLDAFDQAASKFPSGELDDGTETIEEAMICATAAMYASGYLDLARKNCSVLRQIFSKHPGIENLCRVVESSWKTSEVPACKRMCIDVKWLAPWEDPLTTHQTSKAWCTRRYSVPHAPVLYEPSRVLIEKLRPPPPHPIVVLTSPRPVPTLPATVNSLQRAGLSRWPWPRILVSDGRLPTECRPDGPSAWDVVSESPSRSGSAKTFVRALEEAIRACPVLELVTVIEDDVEFCENFLDYVRLIRVPSNHALVTWFTYEFPGEKREHEEASRKVGWTHPSLYGVPVMASRTITKFVLLQCATLTRETVDRLLACPRVRDWPQENGHDEMLSWALGDVPYAAHFPILVQHVGGLNSAVAANRAEQPSGRDPQAGERTSPHYVGRDFNAISLLKETEMP